MELDFQYFLDHKKAHGFPFNKNADFYEEFNRLGFYVNWDSQKFVIKKQKFLNSFLCSQNRFISHFENFYCFKIQKDNEPNEEFEMLAKHMKWNENDYLIFKKQFSKIFPSWIFLRKNNLKKTQDNFVPQKKFTLEKEISNKFENKIQENFIKNESPPNVFIDYKIKKKFDNKNEENLIENGKNESLEIFFSEYQINCKFNYNRQNNPKDEFERLASHMKWKNFIYSFYKKKFNTLHEKSGNNLENEGMVIEPKTKDNPEILKKKEKQQLFQNNKKNKFESSTNDINNKDELFSYKKTFNEIFFLHYQNNYFFKYNRENEPHFEFERLAKKMNWNDEIYSCHFQNFHQQLIATSEKYEESKSETNIQALKKERDVNNQIFPKLNNFKNKEIFGERKIDEKKENDKNNEDYDDATNENEGNHNMSNFTSIKNYFRYFKNKYNFEFQKEYNALINFEKLANFMEWSRRYDNELKKIKLFKEKNEDLEYLKEFYNKTDWKFDRNLNIDQNFENMSEYLGWKEYKNKKNDFDDLVAKLVEEKLSYEKLKKMQRIIRKYNLTNIIPNTIEECSMILERSLFLNIYDFVANNEIKFPDLQSLRKYELENQLDFPLIKAKDSLCYRVLLRRNLENERESELNKNFELIKNENEMISFQQKPNQLKLEVNEFSHHPINFLADSENSSFLEFKGLSKDMGQGEIFHLFNLNFDEIQESDEMKQRICDFERNRREK